jgi:hypothetical protein
MIKKPYLIASIVILVILNAGVIWVFWQAKDAVGGFASSFKKASYGSSPFNASADVTLPSIDVAGEEITGLERYPKSIRIQYSQDNNTTLAQYQTQDAAGLILSYFKTKLATSGWVMLESSDNKASFTKDKKTARISAEFDPGTRMTSYTLVLE